MVDSKCILKVVVLSVGVSVGLSANAERALQSVQSPVEQLKALQEALRDGSANAKTGADGIRRKLAQCHCRSDCR